MTDATWGQGGQRSGGREARPEGVRRAGRAAEGLEARRAEVSTVGETGGRCQDLQQGGGTDSFVTKPLQSVGKDRP